MVLAVAALRRRVRQAPSHDVYYDLAMAAHKQVIDRQGRTWTVSKVGWDEAAEEDFRFWYEGLTPEERVEAVGEALEGCLKTRGVHAVPRLRRVHRRIKCPWGEISGGRRRRTPK